MKKRSTFPARGTDPKSLLQELEARKSADVDWRRGRNFAYVYFPDEHIVKSVKAAYQSYFSENALNPTAFPSLRKLEAEVISMCADLFNGPKATGSLTSGGTESILMAVKTARRYAEFQTRYAEFQTPHRVHTPNIVLPATAHPAFHKAAYYFGLETKVVPVDDQYRADPLAMEAAIDDRTILMVGSAPSYPQGAIDPIPELAAIAQQRDILFHVDACVGGFLLPFLRKMEPGIPNFDFSVPGVTSISADIHKYGYAAKGASAILYRDRDLRKMQFYVYTDWTGGIYGSPTMTGTRPGGAIAAAWLVMRMMGREGYELYARQSLETARIFQQAFSTLPEIEILGEPLTTLFAVGSETYDIYELGDELGENGWFMDRQQLPPSLHFTVTPAHAKVADEFLADLQTAYKKVEKTSLRKVGKSVQVQAIKGLQRVLPAGIFQRLQELAGKNLKVDGGGRTAAMYGMMGALRAGGDLDPLIRDFLDKLFTED